MIFSIMYCRLTLSTKNTRQHSAAKLDSMLSELRVLSFSLSLSFSRCAQFTHGIITARSRALRCAQLCCVAFHLRSSNASDIISFLISLLLLPIIVIIICLALACLFAHRLCTAFTPPTRLAKGRRNSPSIFIPDRRLPPRSTKIGRHHERR